MSLLAIVSSIGVALITGVFIRLSQCLPQYKRRNRPTKGPLKALIFFGSGGHTTEMLRMIPKLNSEHFQPMMFILSHSDSTSEGKIKAANLPFKELVTWHRIFRSREVKQNWISTIFTTLQSLVQAFILVFSTDPDVIICNGPGTCAPICYAAFILHFFFLKRVPAKIIFVESFCRVKYLSLTGKLLYPIADKFLVQWPGLAAKYPRAEYVGTLC